MVESVRRRLAPWFSSGILVTRVDLVLGHDFEIIGFVLRPWVDSARQSRLVCSAILAVILSASMAVIMQNWFHLLANLSNFLLKLALCHI